jgi:3',5'-cyclic AMP phosphodiesterase CpdA
MKHKGKVGILHITDIHFGHNKVSAESIANSIMTMILDNDKDISKNIDLIILGGDEFDDLLTADSEDFQYAIKFFIFLSKYCSKNKIKIRCVEGTNSHSYGQMKTIGPIIETDSNCDFKYVDRLDIEYIPDLAVNKSSNSSPPNIIKSMFLDISLSLSNIIVIMEFAIDSALTLLCPK